MALKDESPASYRLAYLFVIVSLPLIIYFNTLSNSFLLDDTHLILQNTGITQLEDLGVTLSYDSPSRPAMMLSFAVNYRLGGFHVFGYHLLNLLIHVLTCGLFFVIVISTPYPLIPSRKRGFALVCAALFSCHPIFTEAVAYIPGRSVLLATFFYLLSFYFFIRFRRSGSSASRKIFFPLVLLTYFLAFWSKEIAITFPATVLLYDFIFLYSRKGKRAGGLSHELFLFLKERIRPYLIFLIETIIFFIIRYFYLGEVLEKKSAFVTLHGRLPYFLTQMGVIPFYYLRKFLAPFNLNLDPDYTVAHSLADPWVIASLAATLGLVSVVFILYKRSRATAFSLLFFFIAISPTSSIVPILDVVAEHRVYLPGMGLILFISGVILLPVWQGRGRLSPMIHLISFFLIPCVLLCAGTIKRNGVLLTPESAWSDALSKSPNKARPYMGLGYYYHRKGDRAKALEFYLKALYIAPLYPSLNMNLGTLYNEMGIHGKALEYAMTATLLDPGNAYNVNLLGSVYLKVGNLKKAAQSFLETIRLKPLYAPGHFNLGNVYAQKGDYARAASRYEKALKLNPGFKEAKKNLRIVKSLMK